MEVSNWIRIQLLLPYMMSLWIMFPMTNGVKESTLY